MTSHQSRLLTADIKKLHRQDWNMEIGCCVLEVLKRACQSQKSSSKSRQRTNVRTSSFGVLVFIRSSIKVGFISVPLGYHQVMTQCVEGRGNVNIITIKRGLEIN